MLVKFFNHGTGEAEKAVNYLFSDYDHTGELRSFSPELIEGDPLLFCQLVNSLGFTHRYKSGVLSFTEPDLPQETVNAITSSFEKALMPGMDKNQYDVLWVKHRDKGRLELHFVFANVELITGKNLIPYFHRADLTRVNAWKNIINIYFGLTDPEAPSKSLLVSPDNRGLPGWKILLKEKTAKALLLMARKGVVRSRSDVVRVMEEKFGFEVDYANIRPRSISIKDPKGGVNIRFSGALFSQDFVPSEETLIQIEHDFQKFQNQRMTSNLKLYAEATARRIAYLEARYPLGAIGYEPDPSFLVVSNKPQKEKDSEKVCREPFNRSSSMAIVLSRGLRVGKPTRMQIAEEQLLRALVDGFCDSISDLINSYFEIQEIHYGRKIEATCFGLNPEIPKPRGMVHSGNARSAARAIEDPVEFSRSGIYRDKGRSLEKRYGKAQARQLRSNSRYKSKEFERSGLVGSGTRMGGRGSSGSQRTV